MPDKFRDSNSQNASGAERVQLTAELERALLRALRANYEDINQSFFKGLLARPTFSLSDTENRLGQWEFETRTLEISRHLLVRHGWGGVTEVLKHEMAHQYCQEVLCVEEPAHGPTFRQICAERGIDARAHGMPPADPTDQAARPTLEKISKLLALAESSNEHEAQQAMNAAQRLMLKYNLESIGEVSEHNYAYRHLGTPTGRVNESQRVLATILDGYFFVETIWVPVWRPLEGKRGSVLEVCGSFENLEMAEYVHSFLTHTAERLWREHKRARRLKRNRERLTFLAGVMCGFRDKLEEQRIADNEQGLIWLGDANLSRYMRRRHPYVRSVSYSSSSNRDAHADGRRAGRQIVLHRGVGGGPSGGPKLLTSG